MYSPLLKNLILITVGLSLFLILLYPVKSETVTIHQIKASKTLGAKFVTAVENTDSGIAYAWTKPRIRFVVPHISRTTNLLQVTLIMNLDRPQAATAAQVAVKIPTTSNISDTAPTRLLATFNSDPFKSGFQTYTFEVPIDRQATQPRLVFWLETNPLSFPGQAKAVGMQLSEFKIEVKGNPYAGLLWPQPYIAAVLLLITCLVIWCGSANFNSLETTLLMLPLVLTIAALTPFLIGWSWGLLILALGLFITFRLHSFKAFNLKWLKVTGLTSNVRGVTTNPTFPASDVNKISTRWLVLTLVASLIVSLFLIVSPSFIFDTRLFFRWINKIHLYGPFDSYRYIPDLDYPPLIIYFFWFYSWLLAPFGLINSLPVFKICLASCSVAISLVIWLLIKVKQPTRNVTSVKLEASALKVAQVLGIFSTGLLFNPVVWGQVDVIVGLMVLIGFWLVYVPRPLLAGGWLGLLLIFKPQAWLLLPLLSILLLKKAGWKRGIAAGVAGLIFCLLLSILAFGSVTFFLKFWLQPSLAGTATAEAATGSLQAFNVLWLLGFNTMPATAQITWFGFGIIALVEVLVLARTIWGRATQAEVSLGAAIVMVVFFLFAIKMRERYLYYALPVLLWACVYNRKLLKPYLILNYCCLVNTLYGYLSNQRHQLPTSFYLWLQLLQPEIISWLTLLTGLYLGGLYCYSFMDKRGDIKSVQRFRKKFG